MLNRWKFLGACAFLLIAGTVVVRSLWVSKPAAEAKRIVLENADTAALQSATFKPIEDIGGVDVFVASLLPRLERAAVEAGSPPSSARAFADIVCKRLRMLLARDYQAYRTLVASLTGDTPDGQPGIFGESDWLALSGYFTDAPIADDMIAVRRIVVEFGGERPRVNEGRPAGRFTAIYAPQIYLDLLPRRREREAFEAYVPMIIKERDVPEMNSGGRSHRCFLVLGFIWDEQGRHWIPFRAGVNDPSNAAMGVLPTPWI
jgi:hypothetical protein